MPKRKSKKKKKSKRPPPLAPWEMPSPPAKKVKPAPKVTRPKRRAAMPPSPPLAPWEVAPKRIKPATKINLANSDFVQQQVLMGVNPT